MTENEDEKIRASLRKARGLALRAADAFAEAFDSLDYTHSAWDDWDELRADLWRAAERLVKETKEF